MRNTRIIFAIIAFVATFIFSAGLVRLLYGAPEKPVFNYSHPRCRERQAGAIESLIRRDIRNGEQRRRAMLGYSGVNEVPKFEVKVDAVRDYVDASSSMDASNLPSDFQAAWHKHMQAWRDYAEFLRDMEDYSDDSSLAGKDFRPREKRYNDEINSTWDEVLRLGRTYGAEVY
jgi:hypothetical protein